MALLYLPCLNCRSQNCRGKARKIPEAQKKLKTLTDQKEDRAGVKEGALLREEVSEEDIARVVSVRLDRYSCFEDAFRGIAEIP
jgi:hypothetical protein